MSHVDHARHCDQISAAEVGVDHAAPAGGGDLIFSRHHGLNHLGRAGDVPESA